ncbi:MAG: exo-alpha-sialidase, partial [Planctomycetes bacterium]|nr:exo-alpha-sialidase [Planctomycetota bacterium]
MTVCHHCVRRMGVALVAAAAAILPNVPAAAREDSFTDPGAVLVQRDGKITGRLPAERIQLEYEALDARAEVNAALDSKGNIWAAIGYSVGGHHQDAQGFERLFFSPDGGRTWTSQPLPMTEKCHFLAFTVLGDDALVVVVAAEPHDPSWRKLVHVYRSIDLGKTWHETCQIKAPPYENVGEGFLSMTRLDDGTLLLP